MKIFKNFSLKPRLGFSLVELMISLIIISLVAAAFTPILTKKLSRNSIIAGGSASEITNQCSDKFSSYCKLCTKTYCVQCSKTCEANQYVKTRECKTCNSCSDFDLNCKTCTQDGCTKCSSSDYYLKDGKCTPCPSDKVCDGVNVGDKESCPYGYYCDSKGQHLCSSKFSNCTVCEADGSKCKYCEPYYAPSSSGGCVRCPSGCYACAQDAKYCIMCTSTQYFDSNYFCTNFCKNKVLNCITCDDYGKCDQCIKGYFPNSSGTECIKCNLNNCVICKSNVDYQTCNYCKAGYFVNSNGSCSPVSNYGEKCVAADKEKCLSCASGYILDENNKCIVDNSNEFKCSSPDFMRVGNLCFTRRNMGDSAALPVRVSGVVVVKVDGMTCQTNYLNCCWQGDCENSSDYTTCKRSACNYQAALKVCSSLDIGGGSWRLPTHSEYLTLAYHSAGLGENGAMMAGDGATTYQEGICNGSIYGNSCYINNYHYNQGENPISTYFLLFAGRNDWILSIYDRSNVKMAASIRCVKDME